MCWPGAEVAAAVEAERAVGVRDLIVGQAAELLRVGLVASAHGVGEPEGCEN